ncbi:MAG: DUF4249 domain-containing protein [Bacteroidota bacterium]
MKNYIFFALSFIGLSACNLSKEVELDLPEYTDQPVVECYLQPGKHFRLLLTHSSAYFEPLGLDSSFVQKTLLQGATVTITYSGQTDTLYNNNSFELSPFKLYNYTGHNIVSDTPGIEYQLKIILPNGGGDISAKTKMLSFQPIDSVVIQWNLIDTSARALTYITDDLKTTDFFRRTLNINSLDSVPEQDFVWTDRVSTTSLIVFGTGFDLWTGNKVINTVYHIDQDYYDYLESVQLAILANLNPFAQPSGIKSNVSGSANPAGIFTCLVFDRDSTLVKM